MLPGIGNVLSRMLIDHFGSAEDVFRAKKKDLMAIGGIGQKRIESILGFNFDDAEKEIRFIEKHHIRPLYYRNADYPQKLLHCFDNPVMLYYKGNADINSMRKVAIVGTRNPSEYGRSSCESLIADLSNENILIVSGLAFGIDTIAHKACLKNSVPTVGVLGHGLDRIYPVENKNIAREMIVAGGLLTEFRQGTAPDRQNFPMRNRIVAGICDCVVVVESGLKGGSLITAELGNGYNRDVFAFPGRSSDIKSMGCNYLIKTNKAALVTNADDLLYAMGWKSSKNKKQSKQKELFIDLTEGEKAVYEILRDGSTDIDTLYLKSNLNGSQIAQALLTLEMEGIVISLPGKMYALS